MPGIRKVGMLPRRTNSKPKLLRISFKQQPKSFMVFVSAKVEMAWRSRTRPATG
ncbi:MAG: hypothetical protein KME26_22770 [Oscillatoria princeps RMCB-10]|nr:hypothetical protein [Oscillatoria princeps RMCB-10]